LLNLRQESILKPLDRPVNQLHCGCSIGRHKFVEHTRFSRKFSKTAAGS
jgi:hypothetical protein